MRKFNNKSEKLLTTNSVKVIIESNNNHEVVLRKVNGVSMEFVKVPRSLIYNKRLGDKRILAYTSLLFHNWESKKCDVQELALYCGYSLSRKNSDADLVVCCFLLNIKMFKSRINPISIQPQT